MSPERRDEAGLALDAVERGSNVFISANPSDAPLQLVVVKVSSKTFYTVDDGHTLMNREQAVTFLAQWSEGLFIEITPFELRELTDASDELSVVTKLATDVVALMPFAPDIPVSEEAHAALIELGRRIGYPGIEGYAKGLPF